MSEHTKGLYRFGQFTVDFERRTVTKDGAAEPVSLVPKAFDTLAYLAMRCGEVIGKDELLSAVWPDTVVEENNLSQQISAIRKALGEKRGENRYIATVPGRGFKFVAKVAPATDPEVAQPVDPDGSPQSEPPVRADRRSRISIYSLIAFAAVVVALSSYYFLGYDSSAGDGKKSLAVLPFRPMVTESRDEVFEMGMADTLISRLASYESITIKPLAAVRKYTSLDQDAQAAGRELGADYVLLGNIQRWGDRIRVNVRLVDVADGASIFSDSFDQELTDIFSVQDSISQKVLSALSPHFAGSVKASAGTRDLDAYRYYLQGRYFSFKLTPVEIRKGIECFEKAIEADPRYADAYAAMALAYVILPVTSDVPSQMAFPKAKASATKALELQPDSASAQLVLARVSFWYDWDWRESERRYRVSIVNDPDSHDARLGIAHLLSAVGRHGEAIAEVRKARELDPYSRVSAALEGQFLMYAGRLDESEILLRKALETDGGFWVTLIHLGMVLIEKEEYEEAEEFLKQASQRSGGNTETSSLLGYAFARTGRSEEARNVITELLNAEAERPVPPYNIAMIYNGLGETGKAVEWLEKAFTERDMRMTRLKVDRKWDRLREDPGFKAIFAKMKF